jgi:hypothetical protein
LRLRFSRGEIDPRVLCGRTTTGTFFDGSGVLQTAAIGVPRLTYNPADLSLSPGLLAEEARTNTTNYSEQFDNAWWDKARSRITADAIVSPDGTVDADKLAEDATASNSHYLRTTAYSTVSGTSYTWSIFLKAGERTAVRVALQMFATSSAYPTTNPRVDIDLLTGVLSNLAGTIATSVFNAGNGWYRVSVSGTANANASSQTAGIYLLDSFGNSAYTGDGTSGIYIWGAQLEAGAAPTSYIPTSGAAATRAGDNLSMTDMSWYQQSGGVLYLEAMSNAGPTDFDNTVVTISNSAGTAQDFICPAISNVGGVNRINATIVAGNVSQLTGMNTPSGSYTQNGTFFKAALSFRDGEARLSSNLGNTFAKDNTVTLPTNMGVMHIGSYYVAGNRVLNGVIREIAFIPNTNISDSALQQLTRP